MKKTLNNQRILWVILGGIFDSQKAEEKVLKLNSEIAKEGFWKDRTNSKKIVREKNFIESILNFYNESNKNLINLSDLNKLAVEERDNETISDCLKKISLILTDIKNFEIKCFLSGENDHLDIYMEIHAGAGGTESQDWAEMLRRMYLKWLDKKNFKYQMISEHKGEEAGIKSSTLKIAGENLYGLMKNESGVHRLVRISPFDSGARRHTSFASVWIYPSIDDNIDIIIEDKDLRIDTYRSSGAGGQHVNTTDSAVRITHLPTKIVVQCQNERSQHKNKETCFKMLKARLYEFELKKREDQNDKDASSKTDIGWGYQIRSYVLQPYRLVKDLRFNIEDTNPDSVLNGNIDKFIEGAIFKIKK